MIMPSFISAPFVVAQPLAVLAWASLLFPNQVLAIPDPTYRPGCYEIDHIQGIS